MNNVRLGIGLMLATMIIFAIQDGLSKYLASSYSVMTIVMLRYWFFAAFVIGLSQMRAGGIRRAAQTRHPVLQVFRGVLLAAEICVCIQAFKLLGLVETHAVFASYPLLIAALAGPVLGEGVGWRRWIAIMAGFAGILVILRPGYHVFSPEALLAVLAALLFAVYALVTRYVSRKDRAETSFFYTGAAGAVAITLIAPFWWTPMQNAADWSIMGLLCLTGAGGHYLLIKTYEVAAPGSVQPFAYFQLVFASLIGITFFDETLDPWIAVGAAAIIAAGIYTLWRTRITAIPVAPTARSG